MNEAAAVIRPFVDAGRTCSPPCALVPAGVGGLTPWRIRLPRHVTLYKSPLSRIGSGGGKVVGICVRAGMGR